MLYILSACYNTKNSIHKDFLKLIKFNAKIYFVAGFFVFGFVPELKETVQPQEISE